VDDEQRILDGLRRTLRGKFEVTTATSGPEGLELLRQVTDDPFRVVVSDMMMPGMNGAKFLAEARTVAPDTVRLILSGQADLTSTIAAVNDADPFRFLTKPVEPDTLLSALEAAHRQFELQVAERDLLQQTLTGAVEMLTETLSLASPLAYRRTARVRTLLTSVAEGLGLAGDWRLEVAAMLSQLGCIAVPNTVLQKVEDLTPLTRQDRQLYDGHPELAEQLLAKIHRLDEVARWIGAQITDLSALTEGPELAPAPAAFAAVVGFLSGYDRGLSSREIARKLQASGRFPGAVIEAVLEAAQVLTPKGEPAVLRVMQIQPGMVIDEDVTTVTGLVLVRKGERVTEVLARRLENFARSVGVNEPIKVLTMD
jgi:DNA-binding NarL/FixJ family response regulator